MKPSAALALLLSSNGEFAQRRPGTENSSEYEVFGDLALALSGQDPTNELSERGIAEGFALLNRLVGEADIDTIELLRTGVFEVLCDTTLGTTRARTHLVPAARKIFEEVAADYEGR